MALGTTVKTIDINAKGELSDSLSSSCEDIFLTQMGQDKLRKELLGEGVLMGN
jgi:hypothetical protein